MQLLPIGQILTLPPESPLPGVQGAVKKQGPRKQAPPGKTWSFEIVQIQDSSGVIELKLWNRDPLPTLPIGTIITVIPVKPDDICTKEKPAEGQYAAKKSVDVQKGAQIQFGQAAPLAAPVAAYQPGPAAYQPQSQAAAPWPTPVQPAPAAKQPMDFQATFPQPTLAPVVTPPDFDKPYPPQATLPLTPSQPTGDPVAFTKKRAAELGGLQYYCLRIARHNCCVMRTQFGDEFDGNAIAALAAGIFIQLNREGCNGTGFTVPDMPATPADTQS